MAHIGSRAPPSKMTSTPRWPAPSGSSEWQYPIARPLIFERADLLVWLDLPVAVPMSQVIRRTVARRLRRRELWNGNREAPLRTILSDPDHIVRWAWHTRHRLDTTIPALAVERPGLPIVRRRSWREVDRWLGALATRLPAKAASFLH